MSYRDTLIRLCDDLVDTDWAIATGELQVPSLTAEIPLGETQGFITADRGRITQAFRTLHDGLPPARLDATLERRW